MAAGQRAHQPRKEKSMTRSVFPAALLMTFSGTVLAQTATVPDGQWRGAFGAGLSAATGNTESVTYTINGDLVRQRPWDKFSGYLQAVYGRRNVDDRTERSADQQRGGILYNRDYTERRFVFGALDLERDKLINLNLRTVVATGLGYHVIKRPDLTFDISTGPAYNREHYSTETREGVEWLLAEESTHAFSPTVSFRQRLALYPSLKESGEYRAVFDAGLVFKVAQQWNATVTLNNRYQSNPLPGVKQNDLLFVTGIQYVFNPVPQKEPPPPVTVPAPATTPWDTPLR
jgi:putative salt-induced outer membrane protein